MSRPQSTVIVPASSALPQIMQAGLFYAPNQVRYEAIPVPSLSPGEILIKVDTALTCGTDIKCYRRGHPVLLKAFPSPFGHEFSGFVAALADAPLYPDGTPVQVGDRVVAANSAPCMQCYFCHKGQHNLCEQLDLLNGAYADYIRVPAQIVRRNLYQIPDDLPFEAAAFTEPLAVCIHGLDIAHIKAGDHVAVLGMGPIGQLMARTCKWKGARVTALARTDSKLALAKTFAYVDQTVNLREAGDAAAVCDAMTEAGKGFDVVVEAVGLPETWTMAIDLVRRGGTVVLFGGCAGNTEIHIPTRRLHYDEIRLFSPFHHTPRHVHRALQLITTGDINPTALITQTLPMSAFETALQQVEAGQAMKIALKNK